MEQWLVDVPVEAAPVATWLAAIGTAGALLFALFRDAILRYYRRPKLYISALSPEVTRSPVFELDNRCEVWDRLLVGNRGRGETAKEVEVIVQQIKSNGDSELNRRTNFPLKWSMLPVTKYDVPPYTERWIVAFVVEPPEQSQSSTSPGANRYLCVPAEGYDTVLPPDRRVDDKLDREGFVFEPGNYVFTVGVVGESIRPVWYHVEVSVDSNSDLDEAIEITAVEPGKPVTVCEG